MDDTTLSPNNPAEQAASKQNIPLATTHKVTSEHRQAYGTAKTENLRDSGLWRLLLPGIVVLFCLLLLAFPLFILIPLLSNAVNALGTGNHAEASLLWIWITMMVIEVATAILIIWGLCKIFMTQAINYEKH